MTQLNSVNQAWRRVIWFLGRAVLLATFGMATSSAAIPMMEIDIGGAGNSTTVDEDDVFTITLSASDIPAGSGLFGFGFEMSFDSVGLSAGTPAEGPLWTGFVSTSSGVGSVGITANRFGEASGPTGNDILLASFAMTALAPGSYTLSLAHFTAEGDNVLFDSTVLDGAGSGFFGSGQVVVLVPEPAVLVFLLLGGPLVCQRRLRRCFG
jgi:hypothetical protein